MFVWLKARALWAHHGQSSFLLGVKIEDEQIEGEQSDRRANGINPI